MILSGNKLGCSVTDGSRAETIPKNNIMGKLNEKNNMAVKFTLLIA
jgi:hypothetical protein